MKRYLSMLLVIAMCLSAAACGGATEAPMTAQTAPTAVTVITEPATEPTTEPTLSPEAVFYNSLPHRMQEAVDAGLVEPEELTDLSRTLTVAEASRLLQRAYVQRTGNESKVLAELMAHEEYDPRTADRAWICGIPGLADLELAYGDKYQDYAQWHKYLGLNWASTGDLWAVFDNRLGINDPVFGVLTGWDYLYDPDSDTVYADPFNNGIYNGLDYKECWEQMRKDSLYVAQDSTLAYAFKVYDDTCGRKFLTLEDGYFHGFDPLTVEEAVECALVYSRFPNPMEYPTYLAPEEVGAYNPEIITQELLHKQTTLPPASCESLPSQWHGVVVDDMELFSYNQHPDNEIYAYEIQAIREAGFNYIGLNVDFSWLQDMELFNLTANGGNNAYASLTNKKDLGKLSLQRLEKLDQVIAWCMERDIHVNLRATGVGEVGGYSGNMGRAVENTHVNAPKLAKLWQAIARRYAEIPNEYLSFTLFTSGEYMVRNSLVLPSVEAIREVSPQRCIIADICSGKMDPEEFAQLGVALSFRLSDHKGYNPILNQTGYYDATSKPGEMHMRYLGKKGKAVVEGFTWPYEGVLDAQMLFEQDLMAVLQTAQSYGVGFMLSDFGVAIHQNYGNRAMGIYRLRYADEPYFAMLTDITSTIEELGYGWCFARWYGPYGVAFCKEVVKTSTYQQVEDHPYYLDAGMLDLFRSLNSPE